MSDSGRDLLISMRMAGLIWSCSTAMSCTGLGRFLTRRTPFCTATGVAADSKMCQRWAALFSGIDTFAAVRRLEIWTTMGRWMWLWFGKPRSAYVVVPEESCLSARHWIRVEPRGVSSEPSAVGAVVSIDLFRPASWSATFVAEVKALRISRRSTTVVAGR